jgi:hypothetical protein
MSQEDVRHSSHARLNSSVYHTNATETTNSTREMKERGYYSELATVNSKSAFQVNIDC